MHSKIIFRQALKKDLSSINKLLASWIAEEPQTQRFLDDFAHDPQQDTIRCRVIENGKAILGVVLWSERTQEEARILALKLHPKATQKAIDLRFLQEIVLEFSELKYTRATIHVPEPAAAELLPALKSVGFVFEGISQCCGMKSQPQVHLCKHFVHKVIDHSQVVEFLKDFFQSLRYEIRPETDGFGYRLPTDYRLPFLFSGWHRITRSGSDIIMHPPARILESHELETLFFPLRVRMKGERPLLLPMARKHAERLIETPESVLIDDAVCDFDSSLRRSCYLHNLAFGAPGSHVMRRGLPVLFYVNKMGAVGSGRVEDWRLDEPDRALTAFGRMKPAEQLEIRNGMPGPHAKSGKVLCVRYEWYKPFKKIIPFDEIRRMDENFNPQRTRTLSAGAYQSILEAGA